MEVNCHWRTHDTQLRILLAAMLCLAMLRGAAFAAPSVEDFAHLPKFTDLEVAPGGGHFAARINTDNNYAVSIFNISGPAIELLYGFAEDETLSVSWFRWVSPEYLLVSVTFTGNRGDRGRVQTQERRLFTFNTVDRTIMALFRHKRDQMPVQIQDNVVSYLPDDPDNILLQYSQADPSKPNVYKVSVSKKGAHKRIMRGRHGIFGWRADNTGEIRMGSGVKDNKRAYLLVRSRGEKNFRDISHRVNAPGVEFRPFEFAMDPHKMYVASNHEGDPSGLYLYDISTDQFGDVIFRHPRVGISSISVDQTTSELRSINFVDDVAATKYITRSPIQEDIKALKKQFPGKGISTRSVSSDGNHAVLRIQATNEPGSYFIYNGAAKTLKQLPAQYPGLDPERLGRTVSTAYVARDGLEIPAFITFPPDYDPDEQNEPVPFVIMPHGGPAARDFQRFDYWVQFIVSRGYGVLQMNFRGSAGYGKAFRDAGNREWGQAMQDDITDGVGWLIDENVADAERIAILGGSYGGYAALMGAVKTPDLYRCAISFAGVSDLPDLLRHQRKYIGGAYSTRFIGNMWKDRKMLAANSPARRAEEISVPVLLLHGDEDTVVNIDQSKKMARALRKFDKQYKFITLEHGDHHLSLYPNRLLFLTETEQFLAGCLAQ